MKNEKGKSKQPKKVKDTTTKRKMGRQREVINGKFKYDIDDMCVKIDKYIKDVAERGITPPIVKECILLNGWSLSRVYELIDESPKLCGYIEKLKAYKEVELEKGGLIGKYNANQVKLSLGQLGWSDKKEIETNLMPVTIVLPNGNS